MYSIRSELLVFIVVNITGVFGVSVSVLTLLFSTVVLVSGVVNLLDLFVCSSVLFSFSVFLLPLWPPSTLLCCLPLTCRRNQKVGKEVY